MPEHFRALVVILGLALTVFALARPAAAALGGAPADFARRRNLWLAITLAAFLAHNFWLYIVVAAALLLAALPREPNKLALYFLLLFAVPPIPAEVPGLGLVNYFFVIDHVRLLALALLLPAWLSLRAQPEAARFGRALPDVLLAAYLVLNFVLQLRADPLTNALRHGVFYAFLGVFLPYYVASRSPRTLAQFREALTALVVAALVLSAVAAFESAKHWLLYASLDDALGVRWNYLSYLERGAGRLRALASTGHPIALGYALAVALGFYLYLRKPLERPALWLAGFALLLGGLLAPLSRGPWLGAATILAIFVATGRAPAARLAALAAAGAALLPLLVASPTVVDATNIAYRQRLLDVSLDLIARNPLLGSPDFIYSRELEELRQGQGIIDIVNSYLAVALWSGVTGLSLFAGVFLGVAASIWRAMRTVADKDAEAYRLGRALLAVLAGILVIIFTVSSISVIPVIYWAVAGLGVAYARMLRQAAPARAAPPYGRAMPMGT